MDFGRVALLLAVAEAATKWPQLRAIHDAALQELAQIASGEVELYEPMTTMEDAGPNTNQAERRA